MSRQIAYTQYNITITYNQEFILLSVTPVEGKVTLYNASFPVCIRINNDVLNWTRYQLNAYLAMPLATELS